MPVFRIASLFSSIFQKSKLGFTLSESLNRSVLAGSVGPMRNPPCLTLSNLWRST